MNYLKKKKKNLLDLNNARMLRAVLNKFWKQHPSKTTVIRSLSSHLANHPDKITASLFYGISNILGYLMPKPSSY